MEKRFRDNKPGNDWFTYFIKRHPELTIRLSENIKRVRAGVSWDAINDYFLNLETCLDGVPPSNIINYDETNFTDDPGAVKVVVKRGCKHPERVIDTSKTSISVMIAASADGFVFPPYTVYKSKHIYPTWIEGGLPGSAYNRNSSGWFDLIMFEDWFKTIILPHLRRLEGPKVIIGDNLSSHLSVSVIDACQKNDIRFVLLPPNSTHICQPLDVAFFRPVKGEWRKRLTAWKVKNRGVLPKADFPKILKLTLETVGYRESKNIIAGFTACGIYPLNKDQVLRKIPRGQEEQVTEAERSWTEAIVGHLQEIRGFTNTPERPRPKRGKRLNIVAGKSIVVDDILDKEGGPSHEEDEVEPPHEEEEAEFLHEEEESGLSNEQGLSGDEDTCQENVTEVCDDDNMASACHEMNDVINEELCVSDFVVVQFATEKRTRSFVGKIIEVLGANEYIINFLRKKVGVKLQYFYFPNVKDEAVVIKKILLKNYRFHLVDEDNSFFRALWILKI